MGILRRITEERPPAELVLGSCTEDTVHCWGMPGQAGIMIALFLQFHTAEGNALEEGSARVRFATRNHYPQTFTFTRELECEGGSLGQHSSTNALRIRAARKGDVKQELLHDTVPLQRDPDSESAALDAQITFVSPESLKDLAGTLTVTATRTSRRRCACCSQYFPS